MGQENITAVWDGISIGSWKAWAELNRLDEFGFVMNVAWEISRDEKGRPRETELLENGKLAYHGWLDDNDEPGEQEAQIQKAVVRVREARAKGHTCLITCIFGHNRSSLVVAEYLIQSGEDPNTVIAQIQKLRPNALKNDAFVTWLKRAR